MTDVPDGDEPRRWTEPDGTEVHQLGRYSRATRRPGENSWSWEITDEAAFRDHARRSRDEQWRQTVTTYTTDPDDLMAAYRYLLDHPIFWRLHLRQQDREADLATMNEDTLAAIEDRAVVTDTDGLRNLCTYLRREPDGVRIELEHGPHPWPSDVAAEHRADNGATHDTELNVEAKTWEAAIIALAGRVRELYGDDRSQVRR